MDAVPGDEAVGEFGPGGRDDADRAEIAGHSGLL
jgi:hypothetical protein